jgi:hypothetical protein
MSIKKVFLALVVLFGIVAFMAVSTGTASAYRPAPNSPPTCHSIEFVDEGYWGVECVDVNNNIAFAEVKTDGVVTNLFWDNSSAHIIVQFDGQITIEWRVCDSFKSCTGGICQTARPNLDKSNGTAVTLIPPC